MNAKADKKIRIAYLINHFGKGGGTENQLAILIRNIDRTRFEPHLLIMKPLWEEVNLDFGCKVTFLNTTSFLSLKFPAVLWRLVRYLRQHRIDIIQMFFFDARILGVMAGKLAGIKRIVASRRDFGYNLPDNRLSVLRFLRRFVDYMLVNAHRVKSMVVEKELFPAERITVIHNGVELDSNGGNDPLEEQGITLDDSRPILGMVANLRPVKRIDRFIDVASRLKRKDVQFVLIGWGPDPEKYWQMAREKGIMDRISTAHIVHDIDLIIKRFDVALLTSQSEGLSNSLIEYCLCGKPAAAFDIGGNAEILENDVTGYIIEDGDTTTMAEKVDYLLDHPDIAAEMGRKSAERAKEMFGVSKMVSSTEDFYKMIMQSNKDRKTAVVEENHVPG
ncbi:MAG: glycosyltransferase [bacterium]|nr:glycosyltransferase [bacterium]